jgi:hypothetical protein
MTDSKCLRCDQPVSAESLLEAASGYSTATNSGSSTCPHCNQSLEFRVRSGALELGFTYWAGSMHFEAMSSHRVIGLHLVSVDGRIEAAIGGRVFSLTPSPSNPADP